MSVNREIIGVFEAGFGVVEGGGWLVLGKRQEHRHFAVELPVVRTVPDAVG